MKKASWCDYCVHHSLHGEYSEILKCSKGHKPRFYPPKGQYPHWSNHFGWKRRCEDYKEIKL